MASCGSTVEACLRGLPKHFFEHMLAPFTPNVLGPPLFVKPRSRDEALQPVAFKVQKLLQASGCTSPPCWAAIERSPQIGAQKRKVKSACDVARTAFPPCYMYAPSMVFSRCAEAARYDMCVKRGAWADAGVCREQSVVATSV